VLYFVRCLGCMVAVWSSLEQGDILHDYQHGIALFLRVSEVLFARFFTARMPIFLFLMHFYCCGTPGRYITSVTGLDPVLYIVTQNSGLNNVRLQCMLTQSITSTVVARCKYSYRSLKFLSVGYKGICIRNR
jgi:hypothetical protein